LKSRIIISTPLVLKVGEFILNNNISNELKLQQKILESVNILINEKNKEQKHNRTEEGIITEVISSDTYNVNIKSNVYQIKTINSETYNVGDSILVLILNNNFSKKVIVGKNPF